MVWSKPGEVEEGGDDDDDNDAQQLRSRRRSRPLSTTSTDYTTTTTDTTTTPSSNHTQRRLSSPSPSRSHPFQQAPVLLPYAHSVATQATATTSSGFPSSRTHISPTPAASQEQPSTTYGSQPQSSSYDIPSAQPVRPLFDPTDPSQPFSSMSDVPSPYPSPPDSPTNEFEASLPPFRSRSPQLEESYQQLDRRSLPHRPKGKGAYRAREREREEEAKQPPKPPGTTSRWQDFMEDDPDIDQLLSTVLDGIGRMHVDMDQDDAGRWRIKRTGTQSD